MKLKIFDHFNKGSKCILCGTNKDEKAILIPDYSTQKDGNVRCEQIHLGCLDLAIDENKKVIYQFVKE